MMRHLAAFLGLVLVGLPLVVTPSWVVVAPAAVAALLIAAGIAVLSMRVVAAGVWVSLLEYALALWVGARPLHRLTAVVLGVALVLLLQVVDFARRFQGAAIDALVIAGQVRYWVRVGILGAGAGLLVSGLATGFTPALPIAAQLGLAAAGVLVAFVAVTRLVSRADTSGAASRQPRDRRLADG